MLTHCSGARSSAMPSPTEDRPSMLAMKGGMGDDKLPKVAF